MLAEVYPFAWTRLNVLFVIERSLAQQDSAINRKEADSAALGWIEVLGSFIRDRL